MSDYLRRFKSCGTNVTIADDAFIEHPEAVEVGDNVTLGRGFHMIGKPRQCRFGSNVTFHNNCFIQGSPDRFELEEHVTFFPGNYVSLGEGQSSFVEVGHHSHFAPSCMLYGWGGLKIGPYCIIAAHVVFATIGHDPDAVDRPMAFGEEKSGPITLEEDVWIAANATVTADVTIAKGCVIGANAVVTRDTVPMCVYGGVPAEFMWNRTDRAAQMRT